MKRILLALAVGLLCAADEPRLSDREVADWVAARVRDWQPKPAERRFDDIGWVDGIRAAEGLAKERGRPVFLFTHDGHMAVGRC